MSDTIPDNCSPAGPSSLEEKYWAEIDYVGQLQARVGQRPLTEAESEELLRLAVFPENPVVRLRAITARWHRTSPPLLAKVTAIFLDRLSDDDRVVRLYAARGLAELGVQQAVPHLSRLLTEVKSSDQQFIKAALRKLGHS